MRRLTEQFAIDFQVDEETLLQGKNVFVTNQANSEMRYWSRGSGNLVTYNDQIFCRTNQPELTQTLEKAFKDHSGTWFYEIPNLYQLNEILGEFDLKVTNQAPFYVPAGELIATVAPQMRLIRGEEISALKEDKRIRQAFCYDETDPDKLGLLYYEGDKLLAVAGANQNGRYTWELGIELLQDIGHRGIASQLVKTITAVIQQEEPEIIPVYGTQFSHIRSQNVAIRAGFKLGWAELMFGPK